MGEAEVRFHRLPRRPSRPAADRRLAAADGLKTFGSAFADAVSPETIDTLNRWWADFVSGRGAYQKLSGIAERSSGWRRREVRLHRLLAERRHSRRRGLQQIIAASTPAGDGSAVLAALPGRLRCDHVVARRHEGEVRRADRLVKTSRKSGRRSGTSRSAGTSHRQSSGVTSGGAGAAWSDQPAADGALSAGADAARRQARRRRSRPGRAVLHRRRARRGTVHADQNGRITPNHLLGRGEATVTHFRQQLPATWSTNFNIQSSDPMAVAQEVGRLLDQLFGRSRELSIDGRPVV